MPIYVCKAAANKLSIKKIKTNEDLIRDLINFSPYGAMSQVFIVQAIEKYSEYVIANEETLLKKASTPDEDGDMFHMISLPAWIGTAKDIQRRMQEFYKSKK